MPKIAAIESGCYRMPLPVVLSDSTHGEIDALRADHRARARRGRRRRARLHLHGRRRRRGDPRRSSSATSRRSSRAQDAGRIEAALAEDVVGAATTAAAAGRRPRDLGGRHRAVGPRGASAPASRCGGCSAASIPGCRATPAASTCSSRSTGCSGRPTTISAQGFRAIKMKVGRAELSRGRRARARDAGAPRAPTSRSWPTPTCAGRSTRRSAPRAAFGAIRARLAGGADDPRRRRRARPHRARGRRADRRPARTSTPCTSSSS